MPDGVSVNYSFIQQPDGSYHAWVDVKAPGQVRYRHVGFGKTPLAALKAATKRLDEDLAPTKRGRKPTGYKSLQVLVYGWES